MDINNSASVTFITGGARSGKSSYAQNQALLLSDNPVYIATARIYENDHEFKERVQRHQSDRDERWASIEEQLSIHKLQLNNRVIVIDCVTLWLTNFFSLFNYDVQQSLDAFKQEIDAISKTSNHFLIISNEIGMGIHAETDTGRKFTDLQGWANQYIASKADEAVLMVSGIALTLK